MSDTLAASRAAIKALVAQARQRLHLVPVGPGVAPPTRRGVDAAAMPAAAPQMAPTDMNSALEVVHQLCTALDALRDELQQFGRLKAAAQGSGPGSTSKPGPRRNRDGEDVRNSGARSAANKEAARRLRRRRRRLMPRVRPGSSGSDADARFTARTFMPPLSLQACAVVNACMEAVAVLGLACPLWPVVTHCHAAEVATSFLGGAGVSIGGEEPAQPAYEDDGYAADSSGSDSDDSGGASDSGERSTSAHRQQLQALFIPIPMRPLVGRLGLDVGWLTDVAQRMARAPMNVRAVLASRVLQTLVSLLHAPTMDEKFSAMYAGDLYVGVAGLRGWRCMCWPVSCR